MRYFEAEIHRHQGARLLLKRDPPREAEAEQAFLRAIEVARTQEARWWELRASVSLGRLWQRQGRSDEARSLVANVYNWFTEGFETVDLKEAARSWKGWRIGHSRPAPPTLLSSSCLSRISAPTPSRSTSATA